MYGKRAKTLSKRTPALKVWAKEDNSSMESPEGRSAGRWEENQEQTVTQRLDEKCMEKEW